MAENAIVKGVKDVVSRAKTIESKLMAIRITKFSISNSVLLLECEIQFGVARRVSHVKVVLDKWLTSEIKLQRSVKSWRAESQF